MNTYINYIYKLDLNGNLRQIFKKGNSIKIKFKKEHIDCIINIFDITTKGFYICDYEDFNFKWNKIFNQKINKAVYNHIIGILIRNGKVNITLLNRKRPVIETPYTTGY